VADFSYDQALGRILRSTLLLGVAGTVGALIVEGTKGGGGFLVGATVSVLNFAWLKSLTGSLDSSGKRPWRGSAVLLGARYLIAGGVIYAIVKLSGIAVGAVFAGLLVSLAAVILEVLYELIFLRL
jgi:ATP synthase I chain